ncbi:MAG: DMT family transporter [Pseudomonadota bacterium]
MAIPAENLARGIILILITAFLLAIQDSIFKLYATSLSLWQLFALRGVIALPLFFVLARVQKQPNGILWQGLSFWPLLRGSFMAIMLLGFYATLPFLALSAAGSAVYVAPIFVAILSGIFLNEPVRFFGWLGVCVGFVGVLILLQPGTDAFSPWLLLPLAGAVLYAFAHVITRSKCPDTPLWAMAFALNFAMMIAGLVGSLVLYLWQPALGAELPYLLGQWGAMRGFDWGVLLLLAVFTMTVGMLMAGAYQAAPPAKIATFEYSYLIFAAIVDIVVFAFVPSMFAFIGMGLIVLAGWMVTRQPRGRL